MKPGIVPVKPGITPVTPVKPTLSPIKPGIPGAVSPVKPAAVAPLAPVEAKGKSGTSVIKSAPPKETARITVKPSLPGGPRPGNIPVTAPAPGLGAAPVAVGAAAATAIVAAKASSAPTVAAKPVVFKDTEGSSQLTTIAAGVLAAVTWGTAGLLCYSLLQSN